MTKHTEKAGELPNGSIDFDKVHAAAKAGKTNIYAGAVSKERNEAPSKADAKLDAAADAVIADEVAETATVAVEPVATPTRRRG